MMKNNILILIFFSFCFQLKTEAQDLGYYVENDSIHFQFDIRDYSTFTLDFEEGSINPENINIQNVAIAGDFNEWSKNKWLLKKLNDHQYILSKSLDDFDYDNSTEFKYLINEKYWAEPGERFINKVPAYDKYGFDLHSSNLEMYSALPSSTGNVNFTLEGFHEAEKVIIAGSFNNWNEEAFQMQKTEFGWQLKLQVKPGEYQYKFIVDGNWITDPDNPHQVRNEFDGFNSVMNVKTAVTFWLNGYPNAKEVILSGSFNGWNEHKLKMQKKDSLWEKTVNLTGGKHHYRFIVDGHWIVDPENSVKEYDYDGNINSVKMVR
jgi:hypothetical protein